MTHIQFKNIIEGISRKVNWDIKLSAITVGSEIGQDDIILYQTKHAEPSGDKVMKMSDAMAVQKLLGG